MSTDRTVRGKKVPGKRSRMRNSGEKIPGKMIPRKKKIPEKKVPGKRSPEKWSLVEKSPKRNDQKSYQGKLNYYFYFYRLISPDDPTRACEDLFQETFYSRTFFWGPFFRGFFPGFDRTHVGYLKMLVSSSRR